MECFGADISQGGAGEHPRVSDQTAGRENVQTPGTAQAPHHLLQLLLRMCLHPVVGGGGEVVGGGG